MSTSRLPNIPALRKHQLLLEFASLRHAAPPGVYVSLAPNDPTLWSAVVFVRSGPYASAILRFQIKFPPSYPDLPPLVTFSTDVFHPLIVPLTTYTFSTNASNADPVSATDEERLPPGGFSLRHGFPHWFGRAKRSDVTSDGCSRDVSVNGSSDAAETATAAGTEDSKAGDEGSPASPVDGDGEATLSDTTISPPVDKATETRKSVPVLVLLDYIRSTFDDESVLDSLPLEAAGNPSAWHAWKAHRRDHGDNQALYSSKKGSPQTRLPGDWHWDGIWAKRVQEEVEASHSEGTLFGTSTRGGSDDLASQIRFSRLDDATLTNIKEMIIPPMEEAHE
ncbi:putative ubiquitin-conjugating enzyme [Aspergillus candidus]|uniref:Putative ubiquitin-conjugating enzyme n=1 Tax=Aspergillus candidus TaxID=41067 RepID=A0A2I2F9S6_ASPCN|nr:putative ubiquitin-conjugating enzyme [Aspergillus candidus]PLB37383.1 putative ubiquitin-conjugating enzyme [Aspergillus candidus]